MEVITLRQEEITKYQVIKDSLDRKISNNQAATLLGLSTRQIIRLKSKVRGADLRNLLLNSGLRCKAKSQPKHRSRRTRMPKSGLLIQMDSSEHQWLGRDSIWLIATIDDATGEVPYALFVDSDSTENNMRVIKRLIEKKGIPVALYTDG